LIAARSQTKQLRIWSAACCTGEEAYTIAILLSRLIPNYKNWSIELLASDINPAFIQKARRGRYSAWSFRGAPPWLLERYFDRTPNDHYQIAPFIRDMVQFRIVNLVDDLQPLPAIGMANIDLIFCRNVLMYFSEQQMQKVVRRLHHLQAENGYLFVSASELLQLSSSPYRVVRSDGTIYFQKSSARTSTARPTLNTEQIPLISTAATWRPPPSPKPPAKPRPPSIAPAVAPPVVTPSATERLRALAESLANRGELTEALTTCNAWLVADKLDPQCHYLRGLILQEQNEVESAIDALQKTLYLDPTFVMAHFNLGIIARRLGQRDNATRNLRNARQLLIDRPVEQVLSEFEGITAGRCVEIIQSLLGTEQTV
jgi:chemotaxis protein methyltransferase CheR